MKTAARKKRRRASVSICKQNKTRYDERAEGAALGLGTGGLQPTLLGGGHVCHGRSRLDLGVPGMEAGPCIPLQSDRGFEGCVAASRSPCTLGPPLQHFPGMKNNRNAIELWWEGYLHPRVLHRAEARAPRLPQGSHQKPNALRGQRAQADVYLEPQGALLGRRGCHSGGCSAGGCFRVFSSPLGFLSEKQLLPTPLHMPVPGTSLGGAGATLTMATTTPAVGTSLSRRSCPVCPHSVACQGGDTGTGTDLQCKPCR